MTNIEPDAEIHSAAFEALYREIKGVRPNNKEHTVTDKKRSPVIDYVRSLGEEYRTTQEVADLLGVSPNFVRKMAKDESLKSPSYVAPFGRIKIHLYTPDDVKELRKHLKDRAKVYTRKEYERRERQSG